MISVMEKQHTQVKNRVSKKQVHAEPDILEKYIISEDRGEQVSLPMLHVGGDISRPLNAMRLAEYHKCKDCLAHPCLYLQHKTANGNKRLTGICERHWEKLADTVIGWKGV